MVEPIRAYPFIEKNINNLDIKDIKVAISGLIIDKANDSIILDDGTGQVKVNIDTNLEINSYARVFGRVLPYEDGLEIYGEIIQDFSKIDKLLYKKVKSLLQ